MSRFGDMNGYEDEMAEMGMPIKKSNACEMCICAACAFCFYCLIDPKASLLLTLGTAAVAILSNPITWAVLAGIAVVGVGIAVLIRQTRCNQQPVNDNQGEKTENLKSEKTEDLKSEQTEYLKNLLKKIAQHKGATVNPSYL